MYSESGPNGCFLICEVSYSNQDTRCWLLTSGVSGGQSSSYEIKLSREHTEIKRQPHMPKQPISQQTEYFLGNNLTNHFIQVKIKNVTKLGVSCFVTRGISRNQGFLNSALPTFWARQFFVVVGCLVHCRMFSASMASIYQWHPQVVTLKNDTRHF